MIDVDTSVVTVEGSIARSQRYSGRVLLPSDGDCVRLSSDIVDKQKRNKGFLSSFTAVYSASSATLPIGLENPLLHSGTENNRGVYDDITSTADDSGYWEVNQTTSTAIKFGHLLQYIHLNFYRFDNYSNFVASCHCTYR